MSPKRRLLSADEHALWTTVTRSVAPLRRKPIEQAEIEDVAVPPVAPPRKSAKAAVPVVSKRVEPPPLAPLGRRIKQKISRGSEPIDARIDLHGMTQAAAHRALTHFLMRAQHDGARLVLVITGKGVRNAAQADADPYAQRGVLKRQVPMWLESADLRSLVVGFENAGIGHGGAGALYVRVRRGR